jgi:hypothetical protein
MFNKLNWLFRNFVFSVVLFFTSTYIAVNQDIIDSTALPSVISQETHQDQIRRQDRSGKFYIPDSIFSFRSRKGYVPSLIHNFGEQAASPLKFTGEQWAATGAILMTTAILISLDNDIDGWARTQKEDHSWINKGSPIITEFGGPYATYSTIGFGLLSAALGKEKGVQTSLLATQALITSGLWVQLLKQLTGRERPDASYIFSGKDGGRWHGPFEKYSEEIVDDRSRFSYDSFPSGHTASAFSIATVFATQYNQTKIVPVISYSLASLVGVSRLLEHKHWGSDVFLGAVFGYICGKQVTGNFNRMNKNSPSENSGSPAQITFFQAGNQVGLSIIW